MGVLLRAYVYMRLLGKEGMERVLVNFGSDAEVLAGMTGRDATQAKLVPAARIDAKAAEVFKP